MSIDPKPTATTTFRSWRLALSVIWLLSLTTVGLVFTGYWHAGAFDHLALFEIPHEDHWQVFDPDGYGCTIEMPSFEQEVVICSSFTDFPEQYATRYERPFESFGIAAKKHSNNFANAHLPLKDQLPELLRDVFAPFEQRSIGLKFQSEGSFSFGDYPALQRVYTIPKIGNVVGRAVFVGDRYYLLIATGKDLSSTDPRVQRFFNSLTVTDPEVLESAKDLVAKLQPKDETKPNPDVAAIAPLDDDIADDCNETDQTRVVRVMFFWNGTPGISVDAAPYHSSAQVDNRKIELTATLSGVQSGTAGDGTG